MEPDLTLQETAKLLKMFVSQVNLLDNCKGGGRMKFVIYYRRRINGNC
jgi:hypothetical protein